MDFVFIIEFIKVVAREVWQRRFLCFVGFVAVSFVILVIGILWPSTFQTSVTIYADNQNILGPLLKNQAAQTKLKDQTKVVKDMLHSPRILQQVAEKIYVNSAESQGIAGEVGALRGKIEVKKLASGYIKVSYKDSTAHGAYTGINAVVDVFLRASAEEQRAESREAFLFIDNQVRQYKEQLVMAEERLKEFRAANFDGGDADESIRQIRDQIEQLKIAIDEDTTTMKSLELQLNEESEFTTAKIRTNVYIERLERLEAELSALLLSYTEDYPDVVSLRYQIEDIKRTIAEADQDTGNKDVETDEMIPNPLYMELRSRLSQVKTDIQAKNKRLLALDRLLEEGFDRRKRVAERGAEESELTRDYNVTKRIYEDMLERKEKARLSMTLNVEGQGVTYRVQEPALLPTTPVGLRTLHFVIMGPFLGVLFVIGLAAAYVLVDPRIRFNDRIMDMGSPVLAIVPHVETAPEKHQFKVQLLTCLGLTVVIMALYLGVAYSAKVGLI